MCSIFDSKAEAWTNPMYFQAVGQAIRQFSDVVNDEKSDFFKHPEDYVLFLLGTFNQRTGLVEVLDAPESLAVGVNVKLAVGPMELMEKEA